MDCTAGTINWDRKAVIEETEELTVGQLDIYVRFL
jgi:hypothetical protein